jgi:hypothetical protein
MPARAVAENRGLFDLGVRLEFKAIEIDGSTYYATTPDVAEAILDVFEHRVPALQRLVALREAEVRLLMRQVETATRGIAVAEAALAGAEEAHAACRDREKAGQPSLVERIFLAKELWLAFGIIVGIAGTAVYVKLSS